MQNDSNYNWLSKLLIPGVSQVLMRESNLRSLIISCTGLHWNRIHEQPAVWLFDVQFFLPISYTAVATVPN